MSFLGFLFFVFIIIANAYFGYRILQWLRDMTLSKQLLFPNKEQGMAVLLVSIQAVLITGFVAFHYFNKPMRLKTEQIYGTYRIDKSKFDKQQAAWQYENFELEIGRDHVLRLYQLQPSRQIIDSVEFTFSQYFNAPHISLNIDSTRHHILSTNPTLYRKPFSFYYVFESRKFGNMFFEKVYD